MDGILIWLKDYGIAGGLVVVILVGIIKFICGKFKQLSKDIADAGGKITNIHVAVTDEKGQPVVHHDLISETLAETYKIKEKMWEHDASAQRHYSDVARLADENKVKDCDVSKCLHINLVTKSLENVIDRINQFEETARESRGDTQLNLNSLRSQMTDLTRDILATIRVFRGGSEE